MKEQWDIDLLPLCFSCVHLASGPPLRCAAFPDRIPDDILRMKHIHETPYSGDGGIVFEPDVAYRADTERRRLRDLSA